MSAAALSRLGASVTGIGDLELESGDVISDVSVAHRSWGRLSPTATNAVVVCHALTGTQVQMPSALLR